MFCTKCGSFICLEILAQAGVIFQACSVSASRVILFCASACSHKYEAGQLSGPALLTSPVKGICVWTVLAAVSDFNAEGVVQGGGAECRTQVCVWCRGAVLGAVPADLVALYAVRASGSARSGRQCDPLVGQAVCCGSSEQAGNAG